MEEPQNVLLNNSANTPEAGVREVSSFANCMSPAIYDNRDLKTSTKKI